MLFTNIYNETKRTNCNSRKIWVSIILFALSTIALLANDEDVTLLNQYLESKGNRVIIFDCKNIKQYWVDKSVCAQENYISIQLNQTPSLFRSTPLKLQLINVNEAFDCTVEVVTDESDLNFSVLNSNKKPISNSTHESDFIHFKRLSSTFHLEDTVINTFFLEFNSNSLDSISIKTLILSFSQNLETSFLVSPGNLKLSKEVSTVRFGKLNDLTKTISVTGKQSEILSTKKILVGQAFLSSKATIKNLSSTSTQIYFGYIIYDRNGNRLDGRNFPYNNNNNLLNVVSYSGNELIVDSDPAVWSKNCFVAFNANEDLSDIPNTTVSTGRIVDIKKLDNGNVSILFNQPNNVAIKKGSKVRIHGFGGQYFYTQIKVLKPEEEETFSSTIKKDDSCLQYRQKDFPKGTYYAVPVILSYSVNSNEENTVEITDYSVSY